MPQRLFFIPLIQTTINPTENQACAPETMEIAAVGEWAIGALERIKTALGTGLSLSGGRGSGGGILVKIRMTTTRNTALRAGHDIQFCYYIVHEMKNLLTLIALLSNVGRGGLHRKGPRPYLEEVSVICIRRV
jgi:hypothetical protein